MLKPFGLREVVETAKKVRDERKRKNIPPKKPPVKQEEMVTLSNLEKQRLAIDESLLCDFVTPTILPMFYEVRDACKQLGVSFVYPDAKRGIVRSHVSLSLATLTFQISILDKNELFCVICQLHFIDQLPTDDMSTEDYRNLPRELYYCFDDGCTVASDVLLNAFRDYITICFETS